MTFEEVLAAMQTRLGKPVGVVIEGSGPAVLVTFRRVLAAGHDLGAVKSQDNFDAPVYFTFEGSRDGLVLYRDAFVSARELGSSLLRVEQVGEVAFMIEAAQ